jgi:hypothetical protein
MGYALITAGGENGRYTISLDYGETQRAALAAIASAAVVTLESQIIEQQEIVDEADAAEAVLRANLDAQFNFIAEQMQASPGGSTAAAQSVYEDLLRQYRLLQAQHEPARTNLRKLKATKAAAQARATFWAELSVTSTREAWCVDFTEDAAGYVATVEIPGEPNLTLIAPGGRTHIGIIDGFMTARELMSPEQAYFNAAILPGWQKFKPTYRWGTITAINDEAETVDIALFDSTSSAQRLGVNQAASLSGVAVEYMECGHTIFEVGDRVVVQFVNQNWAQPKVIGFVDNPRACRWPVVGSVRGPSVQQFYAIFGTRDAGEIADLHSGAATVECRVNRGSWFTMTRSVITGTAGFGGTNVAQYAVDTQPSAVNVGDVYLRVILQPFVTADTAGDSILPDSYAGGVYLDSAPQSPPAGTFPSFTPRSTYSIVEVRATLGGETLFNAAIEEIGYSNEVKAARVRGVGGYLTQIEAVTQFTYDRIVGEEYRLFNETGD